MAGWKLWQRDSAVTEPAVTGTAVTESTDVEPADLKNVPVWTVGDVVAGLYEVLTIHESGGMALVYRVRHQGWGTDLAVKTPRNELIRMPGGLDRFVAEAETWVAMGLHPHLCACHYVRTIDGLPRVFAEYVEGGSLRDWIDDRRLYAGGHGLALIRILDVAIQTARGLGHAHRLRFVHQDVKPANVLLDSDGTAKVTDFGLARAGQPVAGASPWVGPDRTVLATVGGLTPAYASPEQASAGKVGRRSDVWSFGVLLLEMFCGRVSWGIGPLAGDGLRRHLADGPSDPELPPMPAGVADLIAACLQPDPDRRPAAMNDVAALLIDCYAAVVGTAYPRAVPDEAELRADELNNRALSLLDLGREPEAGALFAAALQADAQHPAATYNLGLMRWRAGQITDLTLVHDLTTALTAAGDPRLVAPLLAEVHLERGAVAEAITVLERYGVDETEVRHARVREPSGFRRLHTGTAFLGGIGFIGLYDDDRLAVVASADRRVRRWNPQTGEKFPIVKLDEGAGRWFGSDLAGTEDRVVAGGFDGAVRIWDSTTGRCVSTLTGHTTRVKAVAMSRDGGLVVSAAEDGTLRAWDVAGQRCRAVLGEDVGRVYKIRITGDEATAVTGHSDGTVRIWNVPTGSSLVLLDADAPAPVEWLTRTGSSAGNVPGVTALALGVDDRIAVVGYADGSVRLWDIGTGRLLRTGGVGLTVWDVALTPDARTVVMTTTIGAGGLLLWDVATGRTRSTCREAAGGKHVVLTRDGRFAVRDVASDSTSESWQLPEEYRAAAVLCRPRSHAELGTHDEQAQTLLRRALEHVDENRFADALTALELARAVPGHERSPVLLDAWAMLGAHCRRTGVRAIWNIASSRLGLPVNSVAYGPGGTVVATTEDGHVHVQPVGGDPVTWRAPDRYATVVTVTPDDRLAVVGYHDSMIDIWEVATGDFRRRIGVTAEPDLREGITDGSHHVLSLHLAVDGRHLMVAGVDEVVRLWDVRTGGLVQEFHGHVRGVRHVRLTPDGRHAVSAGFEDTVRVWNVSTGELLHVLELGQVFQVAISDDARTVVTGGTDLQVWDADTGVLRRTLPGPAKVVVLSADGRFAFSGSREHGAVLVRDTRSGATVTVLDGHQGGVASIALSDDGLTLFTGGGDGVLRRWTIDWALAMSAD